MNRLPLFARFSGLLVAVLSFSLAAAASAFTVPWGDAPAQLGLVNQPEQEHIGPLTFRISPGGTLFVADTVNRSIKEFAGDGSLLRVFARNVRPAAMAFDGQGNLLALDDHTVTVYAPAGNAVRTLTIPDSVPLIEGYAQEIVAEDGMIGVNDPDQNLYLFSAKDDRPATATAMRFGWKAGTATRRAYTARMPDAMAAATTEADAARGGTPVTRATRLAPASATAVRMGVVVYRGTAGPGAVPVWEAEELEPGAVRLTLRTASAAAPVAELPNDYFTTVYRKFDLLPDGTLWQMRPTPAGVEFTRRSVKP
jgi:hypothetical protein